MKLCAASTLDFRCMHIYLSTSFSYWIRRPAPNWSVFIIENVANTILINYGHQLSSFTTLTGKNFTANMKKPGNHPTFELCHGSLNSAKVLLGKVNYIG